MLERLLSDVSRQELYDLVWSTPGTKIAGEFAVSDVAIAKHCKRLDVPRPSRGYWAKRAAGHNPKKVPLPLVQGKAFLQAAQKSVGKTLSLPPDTESLHPLAIELRSAMGKARLDSYQRAEVRERPIPEVHVSKALSERTAQAFHIILKGTEHLGIFFRKSQGTYSGGHFRKGSDRLHFKIVEELVDKPESQERANRRYPRFQWEPDQVPSGFLTFTLTTNIWSSDDEKRWTEGEKLPLEKVLAQTVTQIRRHFVDAQKRHAKEAIEREKQRVESERLNREYLREEAIRERKEEKRKHAKNLESAIVAREEDLLKAAQWWHLHQTLEEFITACEIRWQPEPTQAQNEWLQWAREKAKALSPFETGYPDPAKDGAFNPATVPFGGPYPETREFPRPPTMAEIPAPVIVQQSYGASTQNYSSEQYPFWLKHQKR
jgi:hypothetical protein